MVYGILAASGVIWGACYLLWMYQKVFFGPMVHDENRTLPDIGLREQVSLLPLAALALIMGLASPYWIGSMEKPVTDIINKVKSATVSAITMPDGQK
jgi:NADH-quinone oxidoreductase subunit M